MPFTPEIKMNQNYVEAWGLWWIQWQAHKKERMRRHQMSTQTRLKEFEQRHLVEKGLVGPESK
jgi:hypothetical protein